MTNEMKEILEAIKESYKKGYNDAVEKTIEWLESINLDYYQYRDGKFNEKDLINDFRNTMEE